MKFFKPKISSKSVKASVQVSKSADISEVFVSGNICQNASHAPLETICAEEVSKDSVISTKQCVRDDKSDCEHAESESSNICLRSSSTVSKIEKQEVVDLDADDNQEDVEFSESASNIDCLDNNQTADSYSNGKVIPLFVRKTASKSSRPKRKEGSDRPRDMLMRDLVFWNPSDQPATQWRQDRDKKRRQRNNTTATTDSEHVTDIVESKIEKLESGLDCDRPVTHILAPQVKLDAHGNIVLNEESLVVKDADTGPVQEVVETMGDLKADYNAYRRKPFTPKKHWSVRETIRFYKALSTIGTDFTYMNSLFKNRTREELKRKFKREEKANPHLMDRVLKNRRRYDMSIFDESEDDELDNPVPELLTSDDIILTDRRVATRKAYKSEPNKKRRKVDKSDVELPPSVDDVIDDVLIRIARDSDTATSRTTCLVAPITVTKSGTTIHRLYKQEDR